jgi:thioredoxin-related protein
MNEGTLYDRIRAWVRGTASDQESRELEMLRARQPELVRATDEFRAVHEWTRPLVDEVPASRLEFAALEARIEAEQRALRPRTIRRAAALAGVSLAAASIVAVAVWRSNSKPETLRLTSIALGEKPAPRGDDELRVPAVLASYEPVKDGEIAWIRDADEAQAIARAVDRPVLLFGMFESCPFCIKMKAEGLRDPGVLALVRDYVPLEVDLLTVTDEQREEYFSRGYPLFEVHGENGELVHSFPGFHDAPGFIDQLEQGLNKSPDRSTALDWTRANRAAREIEAARAAEADGKLGLAHKSFLEADGEAPRGTLGEVAQLGIERIAESAREALLAAKDLAARDAHAAERSLELASERFEGSPYSGDLRAALTSLRRTGRFPTLESAAE